MQFDQQLTEKIMATKKKPKASLENNDNLITRTSRKVLTPKSQNQADYIASIFNNDITICHGPAGSGKTAIAVGVACTLLLHEKIEKIIITRPTIDTGKDLGSLPGTFSEKIHPYLVPVLDEMTLYLGVDKLNAYKNANVIDVCPLQYMRGRNFHNCFMILDESQNATFQQIKMFLTRIGNNSKAVLNGDLTQSDLPAYAQGGFNKCIERLVDIEGLAICHLEISDIVRHGIIHKILAKLAD